MTFNLQSARAIAEFNVGSHDEKTPLAVVSQLLLDACIEIERLNAPAEEAEKGWPEPAPLSPDYWESAQ